MSELRRYTFRLYPNKAQTAALERQAVLMAWLWNAALEQREWQWRREVECKGHWRRIARPKEDKPNGLSYFDQARELKHIRAIDPEYAAMSCASLELCLKALDLAFKAFWRRLKEGCDPGSAGYPRYKSSRRHRTIWHRDGSGWKMTPAGKHWKFYFKGVPGTIKARGRFPVHPDEIRTMEIMERDGHWCASVVVRQAPRLTSGKTPVLIEFDLLDEFAVVKNAANGECLPGLTPVFSAGEGRITPENHGFIATSADDAPSLKGDGRQGRLVEKDFVADDTSDFLQSVRDKRFKKFSCRWRRETKRIAKRKAKAARVRKEALHKWTTMVVQNASEITVIAPPIKDNTKSARGDKYEWGGAVKTVAKLNRHTLEQAPALAIQMLEYKASEAGVEFRLVEPAETKLEIGSLLPEATKQNRKLKRTASTCTKTSNKLSSQRGAPAMAS